MKWSSKIGRMYFTLPNTTRVRAKYWIRHNGVCYFTAGYEGFGMIVTFTDKGRDKVFSTLGEAKAYCGKKDSEAVLIEEVIA